MTEPTTLVVPISASLVNTIIDFLVRGGTYREAAVLATALEREATEPQREDARRAETAKMLDAALGLQKQKLEEEANARCAAEASIPFMPSNTA